MLALTRFVLRHRLAVLVAWAAILVLSAVGASGLGALLTNRFTLPGAESEQVARVLEDAYGQKAQGSFTVVVEGETAAARRLVRPTGAAAARAADALPTGRLAVVRAVADRVVSAQIISDLEPAEAKNYTDDMRRAAGTIPGARLYVTGQSAVEYDLQPVQSRDLRVGEFYIAIPAAVLILVFVFGTLAFLLPFALAAFAIPPTLGLLWVFAHFMELSTYITNMVGLIGLGIAIDYSLLMAYRYREERALGVQREEAVLRTMQTSGRAVVFSGTAVAIGLALMLFLPLPFLRGFGLAGLLIPILSVAAALTVLPLLLYWGGDRLDRVRLIPRRMSDRRSGDESDFWFRLARRIMRRPVRFAAVASALLVAAALPVFALELGPGTNKTIPQHLEAVQGLDVLAAAVGEGATTPTEVLVDTRRAGGARGGEVEAAVSRLAASLRADPEVASVEAAAGRLVDPTGRYARIQAVGRHEYGLPESQAFVHRVRDDLVPAAAFPTGVEVLVGGAPAFGVDFLEMTYEAFPLLVAAVLLLTYVLLVRAFRSLLLPLKAIVMNLLAIGAAYGLLVAVFKLGLGEPLGLITFDQVEGWIPIFLFAILFGLSMDYEVFLVSRMREEWDRGRDNDDAVATGLAKTGRLVTAAGLIMVAAFSGFLAGSIGGLQQLGFGLGAAILIDVTLIRALLVPSVMKLFGRWNWWLPAGVARLVRVAPSPVREPRAAVRAAAR